MRTLQLSGIIPSTTLQATFGLIVGDFGPFSHYNHGYFGNFNYCFLFSANTNNTTYDTLCHLLIQLSEESWGSRSPPDGINNWTMIQRTRCLE